MTNAASHAAISSNRPPIPAWLTIGHHWAWLTTCVRRHAGRACLSQMDDRALADLGRHRVQQELSKPFWRD